MQAVDFRAEYQGGTVVLYPETERAETYAEVCLKDDECEELEWSGGIAFDRERALSVFDTLEADGFSLQREVP